VTSPLFFLNPDVGTSRIVSLNQSTACLVFEVRSTPPGTIKCNNRLREPGSIKLDQALAI